MANLYVNHEFTCNERRSLIFQGELLLYSRRAATQALVDHAVAMIAEAFSPFDPEIAQTRMPVEDFVARAGPLKTRFTNDGQTKELMRGVLRSFACDLADTYFDVPRLRIVPFGDYLSSGVSYAYKAHRDIWYSSPTAQVNWWMPALAVTAGRAMSFFPHYWNKEVPNTSSDFDYGEWCRVGRRMATAQTKADTRKHPLPLAPIDTTSELRIAGTPGDVILFSASHLHATAPNQSGKTRFSIDFRTLGLGDLRAGLGAPNIDSRAVGTTVGDFLRAEDLQPFPLSG